MSSPTWAAHFGVSESEYADLLKQLAGKEEPLRWCLLNGRIQVSEYLLWASSTYELPVVRESFFSIPADPVFWDAVRRQFAWGPSFFPLAEWQGVLIIGCLETPAFHLPEKHNYGFVLAEPQALENRFREFEPKWSFDSLKARDVLPETKHLGFKLSTLAPAPAPAPAAVLAPVVAPPPIASPELEHEDMSASVVGVVVDLGPKLRQRPADEVLAEDLPPAPDVSLDDPDGLLIEMDFSSSPNILIVPDGLSVNDLGRPISTAPDGLAQTSLEQDSVMMNIDTLDFSMPVEPVATPVVAPTPAAVLVTTEKPALPSERPTLPTEAPNLAAALAPSIPLMAPPMAASPPPTTVPPKVSAMPIAPASAITPPPRHDVNPAGVSASEPAVPLATCESIDALLVATVAHIGTIFENAMILTYVKNELIPTKWSELLWSAKGEKPDAIKLEEPSFFRVASRTTLPYHGYVVGNANNMVFFNNFNRGILARHVTLFPVLVDGKVHSMLMGLSMKSVDLKASLAAMESLAADFSSQVRRLKIKKAA